MAVLELKVMYGAPGLYLAQDALDKVTKAATFESRKDAIKAVAKTLEVAWEHSAAIVKEAKDAGPAVQRVLQGALAKHMREVLANALAEYSADADNAEGYSLIESAVAWAMVGLQDPTGNIVLENFDGGAITVHVPGELLTAPVVNTPVAFM